MSLGTDIYDALKHLCGGRVSPEASDDNPTYPFIIYQQVGGKAIDFGEKALPDHEHARVQIVVWSRDPAERDTITRQVRESIIVKPWAAQTYGAPVSIYNEGVKVYGARQDFGCWFKP